MDAEPRHRFLKATGILRLRSNLNIILRYVSFLTQVLAAISLVIGPRVKHAGRMYKMCSKWWGSGKAPKKTYECIRKKSSITMTQSSLLHSCHFLKVCFVLFKIFPKRLNMSRYLTWVITKGYKLIPQTGGHDKEYLYSSKLETFELLSPKWSLPHVLMEEWQQSLTQRSWQRGTEWQTLIIQVSKKEKKEDLGSKQVYMPHRE